MNIVLAIFIALGSTLTVVEYHKELGINIKPIKQNVQQIKLPTEGWH